MKAHACDLPETPAEELRFEALQHAYAAHRRARIVRVVAVAITSAIVLARCALSMTEWKVTFLSGPEMLGIIFLTAFVTVTLEWSTRIRYHDSAETYERYRAA